VQNLARSRRPTRLDGTNEAGSDPGRRILLCDDSPAIHEDIRKILSARGSGTDALDRMEADLFDDSTGLVPPGDLDSYHIDSAYQGPEALAMVRAADSEGRPYCLSFVDVRMPPGWDGIETINQLWRVDPDLQVVICTAYSDHSWSEIIRRLAPTDGLLILRKPFDAVEIRQLAHTLSTKWMLRQQARKHLFNLQAEVKRRTLELVKTTEELRRESEARERIETELRLAQKLEAVGLVASGIAHEISTPVQFVGESVDLLRHAFSSLHQVNNKLRAMLERSGTDEVRRAIADADRALSLPVIERDISEALDGMLEGTNRITTIVRAMKEFMHPVRRDKDPADLNQAILNTLTVARSEYKYVARVETDLAADLPFVICHIGDLNQVFLNLIVNAAQAIGEMVAQSHQPGLIKLRTFREDGHAVVEVEDTGSGIPEEARPRVFEPFFTTKGPGKGTGQGLAIARTIVVDRHGGEISFQTEVGRGTTFRVRLPLESPTP
jgi:two-component system, NtrC family, sensor kinase